MLKKQVENLIGFFMFPYSGFEGAAGPGRPAREQKRRRFLDFPTWPAAEDGLTKAGCWCQRCVLRKQARGEGKTSGLKPESQQVLTELKRRISAWAFSESKLTVMKHVLSTWLCVFVKLVCWKSENIPVFLFSSVSQWRRSCSEILLQRLNRHFQSMWQIQVQTNLIS